MKSEIRNNLIFIGNLQLKFDTYNQPLETMRLLKFIMLQAQDGSLHMLLMEQNDPFEYHAEGVLAYMTENNLKEIRINGGGKVSFYPTKMFFHGFSYAFGGAYEYEVESFAKKTWPNLEIIVDLGDQSDGSIEIFGKDYSREKVKYFVDNP